MSITTGLVLLVILLAFNAYFVAAEFAMVTARRDQLEPRAADGSGAAKWALKGIEDVTTSLAMTQLGITACSLLIGAVGEPALAHLLERPLEAAGLPADLTHVIALVIALLVVTFLHMVLGEMVPKNIAIAIPARSAMLLGPILHGLVVVFRPVIALMNGTANLVVRHVFRVEPRSEVAAAYTADQMQDLLKASGEMGHLDENEYALLSGALTFESRKAYEIAIPATDLLVVDRDTTPADVEQLCADTGFSRFPVRDGQGRFVGYVHAKDMLALQGQERTGPLPEGVIRDLAVVSADMPLHEVVATAQRESVHMVVIPPSGHTTQPTRRTGSHAADVAHEPDATGVDLVARHQGSRPGEPAVVMLEDALEELVGQIRDNDGLLPPTSASPGSAS